MSVQGGESIPDLVRRLCKDVWFGNGKPGLTTRMQQAEDRQEQCQSQNEDRMDRIEKRQDAIDRKFQAIILLQLTLLGGVITEIVKSYR